MVPIPTLLVDHVLLGKGRRDAIDRMAQDAGIVVDVWLRYAQAPDEPLRLLLAPQDDLAPINLGGQLHRGLQAWRKRKGYPGDRVPAWVMPAEGFVAATLYLDELVQFVLPMTP